MNMYSFLPQNVKQPNLPFYLRLRVEHMERQLASLTGLVQKALAAPLRQTPPNQQIPTRDFAKERGQGGEYYFSRISFALKIIILYFIKILIIAFN